MFTPLPDRVIFFMLLSSFLTLYPSLLLANAAASDLPSWCKLTPHPQQCQTYALGHGSSPFPPIKGKADFFKVAMHTALSSAVTATKNAYSLSPKVGRDPREKVAWDDCLEVYKLALEHLNKTINPTSTCNQEDAQTWLSAALTYFENCEEGFSDLGLTESPILPLVANGDVSCLISNALAINKDGGAGFPYYKNQMHRGWPSWLHPGDRKLLQVGATPNLVVAKDGTGNYETISAAVAAAGKRSGSGRFVIHVKAGTYKEQVNVGSKNIMLLGDGIGKTIITGSKSVDGGSTTFKSATVGVTGDGFIAQGITFRNTAGPSKHQAVAFRSGSDLSVLYQCSFEAYQDTLYVYSNRQFYRNCNIYGTVDFIFGNAAVVIQSCDIFARFPPAGTNTITAQGRTDPNQNTGIVVQNCKVAPAADLVGKSGVKTYLGRPWKEYSRTIFMESVLGSLINPLGWMPWNGNFALNTLYYAEYKNTGPGSSTANRVEWKGYHVITNPTVASQFTVKSFIVGESWLPATKVPFVAGL
ncbi:hypothetical protein Droror1_Dr00000811 [Drosera rotundifolia]